MPTQEKDRLCFNIVGRLKAGESLDEADKSHLAKCEQCMAQIVLLLDEGDQREAHTAGMSAAEAQSEIARARPEAKLALEQGRRIFEREFGIFLVKQ